MLLATSDRTYIPEDPKEMELKVPPSSQLKTNKLQIRVAVTTHLFAKHVSDSK